MAGSEPGGIPEPLTEPLPALRSLTAAQPSPTLGWQLLDILYAYCCTMRVYHGDPRVDPAEAAATALALSASLKPPEAGAGAGPASSAETALLECLVCAARLQLAGGGDGGSRAFAISVLCDVATLAAGGRPATLCALADLRRLLSAARGAVPRGSRPSRDRPSAAAPSTSAAGKPETASPAASATAESSVAGAAALAGLSLAEAATASPGVSSKSAAEGGRTARRVLGQGPGKNKVAEGTSKADRSNVELRRQLLASERKLTFFLSWANEQPQEAFGGLAAAAGAEHERHLAEIVAPRPVRTTQSHNLETPLSSGRKVVSASPQPKIQVVQSDADWLAAASKHDEARPEL